MDVRPKDTGAVKLYGTAAAFYPASAPIFEGEAVLEAVPAPGYQFDGWTGDITSKDNPLTLVMDCSKSVAANFSLLKYTLTVKVEGGGTTEPTIVSNEYVPGSMVDIVAIPDDGWQFDSWIGEVAEPTCATTTVSIDSSKNITASFSRIVHTLTMTTNGGGSTEPAVGPNGYAQGSVVDIIATPDSGWQFDGWAGDVDDPTSATSTVTVATDMAVTALFRRSWLVWWLIGGGIAAFAAVIVVWIGCRVQSGRRRLHSVGHSLASQSEAPLPYTSRPNS